MIQKLLNWVKPEDKQETIDVVQADIIAEQLLNIKDFLDRVPMVDENDDIIYDIEVPVEFLCDVSDVVDYLVGEAQDEE